MGSPGATEKNHESLLISSSPHEFQIGR